MGTSTSLQQKSLTTKGYFIFSLAIAATLKCYSTKLAELISTPLERPVKLYHAYKAYSLAYNIEQLHLLSQPGIVSTNNFAAD